jgi:hypothetical protein
MKKIVQEFAVQLISDHVCTGEVRLLHRARMHGKALASLECI